MEAQVGKLEGAGEVRDEHGKLKGTITLSSVVTQEQAEQLGLVKPEEKADATDTHNSRS